MGQNNLPKLPAGAPFTQDEANAARVALSGDHVPRDTDGNVAPRGGRLGTPETPWASVYADEARIGGNAIATRDNAVFWNGAVNTITNAVAGNVGACTHLRIAVGGREVDILSGLKIAQGGDQVELTANVRLPRPVGSSPEGDVFDIRALGLRSGLFSYDADFAHSAYTPRLASGVEVHEYGVFYDVETKTAAVAPLAGVFAEPPAAAPAGVGDNDRIWSAANNAIYRRSGAAWVKTREAFLGAISYEANGDVRSVFAARSRRFYEVLAAIPFADYVRFADSRNSDALRWASTLHSNYFGVQAALDFPALTPYFRDGVGGSLTALSSAVSQDAFLGAAASPAEAKPIALANAGEAIKSSVVSLSVSLPIFTADNLEGGAVKISGLYVGDGIAGWGRDADERTLLDLAEYPAPVVGMHPFLPARAIFYAFRAGMNSSAYTRPFSAGLKCCAPPLPDGAADNSASGVVNDVFKSRVNNSNSPAAASFWVLLRRPDHLLGREEQQFALPPATTSSDYGTGETRLPNRFGIARAL